MTFLFYDYIMNVEDANVSLENKMISTTLYVVVNNVYLLEVDVAVDL